MQEYDIHFDPVAGNDPAFTTNLPSALFGR
jgi:hypothetical protein